VIEWARADELAVVQSLHDRYVRARRHHHRGDRELVIELVHVKQIGPKLIDQLAGDRSCLRVPEGLSCHRYSLRRRLGVACLICNCERDESSAVDYIQWRLCREERDLMASVLERFRE
jgi:hypothetical protein